MSDALEGHKASVSNGGRIFKISASQMTLLLVLKRNKKRLTLLPVGI